MQLFYTPDLHGDNHFLNDDEALHCISALRLKSGDHVYLTDGRGNLSEAVIEAIDRKKVLVHVENTITAYNKRKYYLHIAIAPTKSIDRFEWFIEKATEIGIDEITPIITDHSERKKIRLDRTEKIMIAAMKQSIKAYKPKLNSLTGFGEFVEKQYNECKLYIAHCHEMEKSNLYSIYPANSDVLILIGPEGDFSEKEIEHAMSRCYRSISLGNSRLRTETAGIVACHSISLINQSE
ncbi:MAG: 16S rRNA (uracil(1498)-N(3))-methyltransferase [Bacteroidales bacterium]|nr:16S rRNA (uracil(1498)-N(3))-methyltransferase [Bacteroidales bacterium]